MGGVVSTMKEGANALVSGARLLTSLNTRYQNLFKRINSEPPLPLPNSTQPYWLDDAPFPELNECKDPLPIEADLVIIGSGITASAAAKTILELKPKEFKVLVLEAREICSGATGRNGGHIKADPYRDFIDHRKTLGSDEEACQVVRFLMKHLPTFKEFADTFPQAQIREVETVDFFMVEKDFELAKKDVAITKKALPEIEMHIWDREETREKYDANEMVVGAVSYKAGAMWPFRFVTSLWKQLLDQYENLTLLSHTPVLAVRNVGAAYEVETPKGTIKATHVLHATNGWAGRLLPELRPCLTGVRGHMSAQKPGDNFPGTNGQRSWSMIYLPGFDYVTQLPDNEDGTQGDVMMGGGFFRSVEEGVDNIGTWDDSTKDAMTMVHVHGIMPTLFEPKWGIGGGLRKAWSGIMGYTGDFRPFVDRVPEKTNKNKNGKGHQWIAAGFNGHGMVWSWLSGTAIGVMIAGKEEDVLEKSIGRPAGKLDDWFPRKAVSFDDKRLKAANLKNLAGEM